MLYSTEALTAGDCRYQANYMLTLWLQQYNPFLLHLYSLYMLFVSFTTNLLPLP